jgi:hypothetical protein
LITGDVEMKKISPSEALYIKLGSSGEWEHQCVRETQTLRLGYSEVDHDICLRREWDKVKKQCKSFRSDEAAATRDVHQIRKFYEAGEDVLWVTFYANKLWWCFSKPEVTQLEDQTKSRPVIGKWQCTNIEEHPLRMDQLSGSLISMQAFRGTICSVREFDYLIKKINGIIPKRVEEAQGTLSTLENKLEKIIQDLHWKDFEILIDLIFRQAGWQRVSCLGETQKALDLVLLSPITKDRYIVQAKSKARLADFEEYQKEFKDVRGEYSRFYFVVHSPSQDLKKAETKGNFELILVHEVAQWAIKYGLTEWIIAKAG